MSIKSLFSKKNNNYTDEVSFDLNSVERGHHRVQYKNVPMIKCPFDYVLYQMIIFEVKPDLIIEIGTNRGGSALYFADLLELLGENGEVHTMDIQDIVYDEVKKNKRIKFFDQGFQGYSLNNTKNFQRILIIEDGSHTYDDVRNCIEKFKDVVTANSYFIIEDGILDKLGWKKQYQGGPNKAIKEFISNNNEYIIDRSWCDFFGVNSTFNTNGFLKKIK